MKTIDLRVLVDDDQSAEQWAEMLVDMRHLRGHRVLGAVELINTGFGDLVSSRGVWTRPDVVWDGNPQGEDK